MAKQRGPASRIKETEQYFLENPNATVTQASRDLKMCRPTIYKHIRQSKKLDLPRKGVIVFRAS